MTDPEKSPIITKKHEIHLSREQKQKRYLLTGLVVTLVLVVGLIGYGLLDQFVLQSYRPIATVGDTPISIGYYQRIAWLQRYILYKNHSDLANLYNQAQGNQFMSYVYGQQIQSYEQQLAPSNATQLGESILNRMAEDIVLATEAKNRNIIVSNEEINAFMQEKIFGYFANGTPTPEPTITPFSTSTLSPTQLALYPPTTTPTIALTQAATIEATVAPTISPTVASANQTPSPTPTEVVLPTATPFTQDGYNQLVNQYVTEGRKYGLGIEDIKTFLRGFILRDKMTTALSVDLKPEQEQVWARHILVKDEETAKQIKDRLSKGEDFAKIATELSTDTGSKASGGDLGWSSRGKMVAEFENAAFALKIGEISDPVKSQFGYHIIQVLGHEVRPISESDFNQLKSDRLSSWLKDAMAKVKFTKVDNYTQYIPTEPTLKPDEIIFPDQSQ